MNLFSFLKSPQKRLRNANSIILTFAVLLTIVCVIFISHPLNTSFAFSKSRQKASLPQQDDFQKRSLRERIEKLPFDKQQRALAALNGVSLDIVDENLRIDANGDLYFVCPAEKDVLESEKIIQKSIQDTLLTEETFALSAVPVLHSRPGSSKMIILDFDGFVVTNTAWNTAARPSIPALAYDTNGDPNTFSAGELAAMENIWKRIAEDYAPFDIDITTEEPATLTSTTGRVLITRSTDADGVANPSSGAGGVAYVGVFGLTSFGSYSPAWVYSNNLGGGREDFVAEAASHEAGHNLGLSHDATSSASYYGGHGSGSVSWAPLMGTGYNRNVSQWSRGEYPDANNFQDDLAIIANKIGYRADDYGDNINSAAPISINNNNVSIRGVIGTTTDIDVFSFATSGGEVTLRVQPFLAASNTRGGNLDAKIELLDSNGVVVNSNDLTAQTYADITATSTAGNYYLRISGVGAGDLITGYSDYASIGQYSVTGTIPGRTNSGVNFDFDGDRKADFSVYRPSAGTWYFSGAANNFSAAQFGIASDKTVPADYDGDGKSDVAVYRPSTGAWYLQRSTQGFFAVQFGAPGDVPAPADFDGDGRAELVIYRPTNGNWYVLNLLNNQFSVTQFGVATDKPVVGDYDGDGRADYAIYRPSNGVWYLLRSTLGFTSVQLGIATDVLVPADYDGDGHTDQAVFRAGTWYLLQSAQGYKAVQFGLSTDKPIAADYDGDTKADVAVYRNGVWYYQKSGNNNQLNSIQFGMATDNPIPASFIQ